MLRPGPQCGVQLPQEGQAKVVAPPHDDQQRAGGGVDDQAQREAGAPEGAPHGRGQEGAQSAADEEEEPRQGVEDGDPPLEFPPGAVPVVNHLAEPSDEEPESTNRDRKLYKHNGREGRQLHGHQPRHARRVPDQHGQEVDHHPDHGLEIDALPDRAPVREDVADAARLRGVDQLEVAQVGAEGEEEVAHKVDPQEDRRVELARLVHQRRKVHEGQDHGADHANHGNPVGDRVEEVKLLRGWMPQLMQIGLWALPPGRPQLGDLPDGPGRAALPPRQVPRPVLEVLLVEALLDEAPRQVRQIVHARLDRAARTAAWRGTARTAVSRRRHRL
mmetsp:Transcript_78148/g.243377  ORF Transcript_78148/g.243377 Transcript_78148/m.243377 type:complete len:331 (+) Transcript_78148:195-1187(+)